MTVRAAQRQQQRQQQLMRRYPMVEDLVKPARQRIPAFAMAYLEHGSGKETLLSRNLDSFDIVQLTPRLMREMSGLNPQRAVFNTDCQLPLGIAPVGLGAMVWPGAERYLAHVARERKIPMILSGVASADIEEAAEIAGAHLWFQMYSPDSEAIRRDLMQRASRAGVEVLVITVDVPSPARRERALRAGLDLAPKINPRYVWQAALHPRWAWQILRKGMPKFACFAPYLPEGASLQQSARFVGEQIQRQVSIDELKSIRDQWQGKLVVKGILHEADARLALEHGADAIYLSNHGGRQSDAEPTPLSVLPAIRREVGDDVPVFLDSGVRSGLDVLRALALGADFVFAGRAFYYGLAALGAEGPAHVVSILADELRHSMRQMGVLDLASPHELSALAR